MPEAASGSVPLVLASGSAARHAMLVAAGLDPLVAPAAIDEEKLKRRTKAGGLDAGEAALRLAEAKARAVAPAHPGSLVIGADQMLVSDGEWFDKPGDMAAARRQLLSLRGRTHLLPTAVVCLRNDICLWRHVETPRLTMRRFSDDDLDAVLAGEGTAVLGSVGAYRIEGPAIRLFESIEGDWFAILGMPLLPLLGFLRDSGTILG
jgi:septum formation protein